MTLSRIVSHEPREARSWRVVSSGERSFRVAYGLVSGSGVVVAAGSDMLPFCFSFESGSDVS